MNPVGLLLNRKPLKSDSTHSISSGAAEMLACLMNLIPKAANFAEKPRQSSRPRWEWCACVRPLRRDLRTAVRARCLTRQVRVLFLLRFHRWCPTMSNRPPQDTAIERIYIPQCPDRPDIPRNFRKNASLPDLQSCSSSWPQTPLHWRQTLSLRGMKPLKLPSARGSGCSRVRSVPPQ